MILKSYDANLPLCRIDSNLIKQAILNIIINAKQAMENGGELMVRTSRDKKYIQIDITDTGLGIPKDIIDKIFQVYFSTKRPEPVLVFQQQNVLSKTTEGLFQFRVKREREPTFL